MSARIIATTIAVSVGLTYEDVFGASTLTTGLVVKFGSIIDNNFNSRVSNILDSIFNAHYYSFDNDCCKFVVEFWGGTWITSGCDNCGPS